MQFSEFTRSPNALYGALLRSPTGIEITLHRAVIADAVVSPVPDGALKVGASWVRRRARAIRDELRAGRPVAILWQGRPYAVLVPRGGGGGV